MGVGFLGFGFSPPVQGDRQARALVLPGRGTIACVLAGHRQDVCTTSSPLGGRARPPSGMHPGSKEQRFASSLERRPGGSLIALVMSGLTVRRPESDTERTQQRVLRNLALGIAIPVLPASSPGLRVFRPLGCSVGGEACFLRPRAYGGPRHTAQTANGPLPAPRPAAGFPRRDST